MNRSRLSFLFALALLAGSVAGTPTAAEKPAIKITNAKLASINYGIDSLEYWVMKMKPGDSSRAAGLMRDYEKLVVRFNRIPKEDSQQYAYLVGRFDQVKKAIKQKSADSRPAVTKPSAGTVKPSATSTMPDRNLANLDLRVRSLEQDAANYDTAHQKLRARIRGDLESLRQSFARIQPSNHPSYQAMKQRLERLETTIQPGGGKLQMSADEVVDFVNQIQKKYSEQIVLPQAREIMRTRELTTEDVDLVVAKIKDFAKHADQDLPKLKQVVEATGQGDYWLRWIEKDAIEKLKSEMKNIKAKIDQEVDFGMNHAKNRSQLDPVKHRYTFNNAAALKTNQEIDQRTMRTLKQAERLEQLLNLPKTWSPKQAELQTYMTAYQAKIQSANQVRELPAEVGTAEQHKIAKTVLANKKYGAGKIVKLIVNSKTMPRDRIEHKEFAGRLETIVRKWVEFQVTTVEQEDGKLMVYRNNLAKFSRAPSTTPIDTWIMTKRFGSGEIAREKLNASGK